MNGNANTSATSSSATHSQIPTGSNTPALNMSGAGANGPGVGLLQANQPPQASNVILTRKCLQDLVKHVDPNEQLDEDVEDLLLGYADEFFEQIIEGACAIASHRKASTVEVKDLQTYLERNTGVWLPGFGSEEPKTYKRAPVTEAHKQRMALIKKQLKKY